MYEKELIQFWKSSATGSRSVNFKKYFLTMQDRAFFQNSAHISVKIRTDLRKNIAINVSVQQDVSIKFWKSSGPAAWIWTRLFLAEDSVLRVFVVLIFLQLFSTPQLPYNQVFSSLLWPLNFYQQQNTHKI